MSKKENTQAQAAPAAKDWTYLAEKAPSDLHVDMARWIFEETGVEISAKAAQVVAVLRMEYQRSDANKNREAYRALKEEVVVERSIHMTQSFRDARKRLEDAAQAAEVKAALAAQKRADAKAKRNAKKVQATPATITVAQAS